MSARDTTATEEVAAVVERLATLLAGGNAPANVWPRLAAFASGEVVGSNERAPLRAFERILPRRWRRRPHERVEARVARIVRGGGDAAAELREHPHASWRALGATWRLAERTGAPLGPALRDLAAGFRDLGQSERDVSVALSGPASTSRLVTALPLIGVALGALLGFDTLGVLTGEPVGWLLVAIGVGLLVAGWWWSRTLVRRASKRPTTPGFGLDLVAMGMHGGGAADAIVSEVRSTLRAFRLEPSGIERASPVLELATGAGVPAAELLRAEASLERTRARTDAARAAAKLGVTLMLPLGVCILPAFLALGVAPLLVAVLQRVLS
ncbi:type II secretion system F family protein [Gulosibacter macacae]|uniref:type II secretion system F family protein n=1 Tax=Gulosibacter macacae TaxID=2488791 RepID=UPI001F422AA9|nr:hypothetical protein [Gulosibacter macacae]